MMLTNVLVPLIQNQPLNTFSFLLEPHSLPHRTIPKPLLLSIQPLSSFTRLNTPNSYTLGSQLLLLIPDDHHTIPHSPTTTKSTAEPPS